MKKLLALCALALTVGYVQAQTNAGGMMFGGNIGYQSQKSNWGVDREIESKTLTINPQFGYFVADNLGIGLSVNYTHQKNSDNIPYNVDDEATSSETILAPFVRYYVFTPNEKFAFYAEASVGIGFSRTDPYYSDEDIKGKSFNTRLSPGFSYFFNEKWALDLQLSGIAYSSNDPNTDDDAENDKSSSFKFGASSLNPSLGFRYFIGK
jgi:outer membrane protein